MEQKKAHYLEGGYQIREGNTQYLKYENGDKLRLATHRSELNDDIEAVDLTNLTDLGIYGNPLTHLPIEMGYLQNLKTCRFWGNDIDNINEIRWLLPQCF